MIPMLKLFPTQVHWHRPVITSSGTRGSKMPCSRPTRDIPPDCILVKSNTKEKQGKYPSLVVPSWYIVSIFFSISSNLILALVQRSINCYLQDISIPPSFVKKLSYKTRPLINDVLNCFCNIIAEARPKVMNLTLFTGKTKLLPNNR